MYRRLLVSISAVLVFAAFASCGGKKAVVDGGAKDKGQVDQSVWPDVGTRDTKPPADQFVWPDQKPPADSWPKADAYTGQPFGCSVDADCFGAKCCPTPWGVKVCADACQNL